MTRDEAIRYMRETGKTCSDHIGRGWRIQNSQAQCLISGVNKWIVAPIDCSRDFDDGWVAEKATARVDFYRWVNIRDSSLSWRDFQAEFHLSEDSAKANARDALVVAHPIMFTVEVPQ